MLETGKSFSQIRFYLEGDVITDETPGDTSNTIEYSRAGSNGWSILVFQAIIYSKLLKKRVKNILFWEVHNVVNGKTTTPDF